jgi:nucleotide-binding universal stress UspA family protein
MIQSILIALDRAENSGAVVELGAQWAKQLDARLTGISIIDQPTMLDANLAPPSSEQTAELEGHWKQDEERVDECLRLFTEHCQAAGVEAAAVKDVGPPTDRILLEANRHDVVLLSPQFQTPESAGDTFTQVLQSAPRPVVGVPRELPSGDAVAIAYAGSTPASRTLQIFSTTGLDQSRQVYVISIDDSLEEAARQCAVAGDFLNLHGIETEPRPLRATASVAEQLLDEMAALDVGLLVLGAHKRSFVQEIFVGSVTTRILDESTVPLFLYH